jgi:hypothetical protein
MCARVSKLATTGHRHRFEQSAAGRRSPEAARSGKDERGHSKAFQAGLRKGTE